MRNRVTPWSLAVLALGVSIFIFGGIPMVPAQLKPKADVPANAAALIKQGDYLVNQVARCGDCHTPRDAKGKLDLTRHLQGSPMWVRPKVKVGEWEDHAPDITFSGKAGRWSEAKMTKYLTMGGHEGEKPDPPMPAYQLLPNDARAVTLYLRSLPGKKNAAGRNEKED